MPTQPIWKLIPEDRRILRALAQRLLDLAQQPVMDERRRLWKKLAGLHGERPMILAEIGGVLDEVLPPSGLRCQEEWARGVEYGLRQRIYTQEQVGDDSVIEPYINVNWQVTVSDYGVLSPKRRGDNAGKLGSYVWDAPIQDLARDFHKLHPRTYSVDRERTLAWVAFLDELFDGILPTRIRGAFWWTLGLTWVAIDLIGLQQLMLYMYDQPDALHRLMAFLRDDHLAYAAWLEREGLLTLNNANDYVGSGSQGYTDELPQRDWHAGDPVRLRDLWVLSESQETVGVSPGMFAEFVFPYQQPLMERFGLAYYGCCEPVHSRWEIIRRARNLRKVSVSPWCDEDYMAAALGKDYVYCRKPAPALISTAQWDEEAIRADLRRTVRLAGRNNLELAMKDVHTLANQPRRLGRWVQLAREVCAEVL